MFGSCYEYGESHNYEALTYQAPLSRGFRKKTNLCSIKLQFTKRCKELKRFEYFWESLTSLPYLRKSC